MDCIVRFVNSFKNETSKPIDATNDSAMEISEANFLFEVPNFSKDKVTLSPTAYVRRLPWTVMLEINETNGALSVFVMCDYDKHNNWSCVADVELKLLSFNSNKPPYIKGFNHCFDKNESLKGFEAFIMTRDLMDPENGYIQNDKIIMQVFMKCEEPKCVAWNSRKHTGFVGLEYKIENSLLNSIVQILYCIEPFRKSIIALPIIPSRLAIIRNIKDIFLELQSSETPVSIDQLIKSIESRKLFNSVNTFGKEYFFTVLHKALRKEGSTKEIWDLFYGQMSTLSTSSGKFQITEFLKFNSINIQICKETNIDELLEDYFASINCMDQVDQSFCGSSLIEVSTLYRWFYGLLRCTNPFNRTTNVNIEEHVEIVQLPSILIIHLDRKQHTTIEDPGEFKFCKNINLSKYVKKDVDSSTKYMLHAVLVQCVTYSAFINLNNKIGWLKFDNDIVSHCTEKEAIDDNFNRSVQMLVYLQCSQTSNAEDESIVKFTCIICMEAASSAENAFSTVCGHVFCGPCIKSEITYRQKCPICKKDLTENDIHPIYI